MECVYELMPEEAEALLCSQRIDFAVSCKVKKLFRVESVSEMRIYKGIKLLWKLVEREAYWYPFKNVKRWKSFWLRLLIVQIV